MKKILLITIMFLMAFGAFATELISTPAVVLTQTEQVITTQPVSTLDDIIFRSFTLLMAGLVIVLGFMYYKKKNIILNIINSLLAIINDGNKLNNQELQKIVDRYGTDKRIGK